MLFALAELLASFNGEPSDPRLADAVTRLRSHAAAPPGGHPDGANAHKPPGDADRLADVTATAAALAATEDVFALLQRVFRLAYDIGARAAIAPDGTIDRRSSLRAFTRVFDFLVEGVLLLDAVGNAVYVNAALEETLRDDEERDPVLRRMRQFGRALPQGRSDHAGEPVTSCEVETATARYRLRATQLDEELSGLHHPILVTLERTTPQLPAAKTIMQRYGLTAAEAAVARLLAQGHSNSRVATKLGISPHTAHHHTESVLLKLGLHSRAEVGAKLLDTRRSSKPVRAVRAD